jgi:hypothetical protein
VKEFAVYTGLRIGLFVASYAVVFGIWALATGDGGVPVLPPLIIAFLVSGIASYFLLDRQRKAFALRVQDRADRASARFEERRSREDRES